MKPTGKSWSKQRSIAVVVLAGIGIQFMRPKLTNPPVVADLHAPPAVAQILRNSCYNCHSNETKLAWFDQVAPAYWLVASDVKKARSHLNFSELGNAPKAQQFAFLFEAITQIQFGAMPLPSYRLAHPESRVTPVQLAILKSYLESTESHKVADAQAIAGANEQFTKWAGAPTSTVTVQPALDGIEFPADYKNWKAISATDREDNGSLRTVLGNDVAIKAVQEGQTNPWPDGAIFAKVAWRQMIGADGTIRPGPFYQVEFMIKESHTYAGTKGWGWARWLGTDLHPYGASTSFTDSCISCHLPMRGNDFVYTVPTIAESSLPAGLPYDPIKWRVINSGVDQRTSSIYMVFGNDAAVDHARAGSPSPYPIGSILAMITWRQQDDPHWFGAKIPGPIHSIEYVGVYPASYQRFDGEPLRKSSGGDSAAIAQRVNLILGVKASVMP
jgi:hypothetical protein